MAKKKTTKWNYGNAIERYPIKEGETWYLKDGRGKLRVHDIYNQLPAFMLEADMVIVDPPWNLSNLNTFYTKADKRDEHKTSYEGFYKQIFRQIDYINPRKVYIEIGAQNVENFERELRSRFKYVERWPVTYYKIYPCFFLRASHYDKSPYDYTGMDEWDAILKATEIEDYETVADLCMGQGLVAVGAYQSGHKFVGTELNKKRLAVTIEKIAKMGGKWLKE